MATLTAQPVLPNTQSAFDGAVNSVDGSPLQHWAWGEFKARHGWSVARDAGDGFAVQALFRRRFSVTMAYVPRGPAVDWTDARAVAACFTALDALCKREGAALALIEPDSTYPADFDAKACGLAPTSLSVQPLRTIIVPCDRDDDALL